MGAVVEGIKFGMNKLLCSAKYGDSLQTSEF
jgi:hypothetical protein